MTGIGFPIGPAADLHCIGQQVRLDCRPWSLFCGIARCIRNAALCRAGFVGREFPEKPFRGMYFATHFHNFYNDAPMEEIHKIMEDLALWGQNVLCVWYDFHHYASIDDPASVEMITRLKDVLCYARIRASDVNDDTRQ